MGLEEREEHWYEEYIKSENSLEKLQSKIKIIDILVDRLASDRNYHKGDFIDEFRDVMNSNLSDSLKSHLKDKINLKLLNI